MKLSSTAVFIAIVIAALLSTAAWKASTAHPVTSTPVELDSKTTLSSRDAWNQSSGVRKLPASHSPLQRLRDGMTPKPGEHPGEEGESRLHRQFAGMKSADFAVLLTELEQTPAFPGSGELKLKLLRAWCEIDPAAASSAISQAGNPQEVEAFKIIAATWFRRQSEDALAWVRALPDENLRSAALLEIGTEQAFSNPKGAIELAREADLPEGSGDLIDQAASAWANSEPKEALHWAESIEDPVLRERIITSTAITWADRDPQAAAQVILNSVEEGTLADNALVGIVQRLASSDIESARTWVAQFPEGRLRERAEQELTRTAERASRVATGR